MIVGQLVFEDSSQRFRVVIPEEVIKHIFGLCEASRGRETGGILIGSYSRDFATAHVGEATGPPRDSKSGWDWFHRGNDGLADLLRQKWHREPRTHYVGEWHFHTANVPWPSPQDKKQMRELARDGRYNCAQPLLIIVCPVQEKQWAVKCFVVPSDTSFEALCLVDNPKCGAPKTDDGNGDCA